MHRKCEEDGRREPRMVRQLMSSRKVMSAMLVFIVATQVGQRPQRQEQKQRQKERERDEV